MNDAPYFRHWHEPRTIEPRFRGMHLDHGSAGVVIAERREGNETVASLVWFAGHKTPACGIRGFGHVYAPAQLDLLARHGHSVARLLSGGRLSIGRIREHAEAIDRQLGVGATNLLDPKRMLVIVADGPLAGAGRP